MSAVSIGPRAPVRAPAVEKDNWPHTTRLSPWLVAAFLVMLFLIPFDEIKFKFHVGVDAKLDRFLLVAMLGVLIFRAGIGASPKTRRRLTAVERRS